MENIFENLSFKAIEIQEGKSVREGVLAVVKGPAFFSNGYSRNGRFYPAELWENSLKNPQTQSKLSRGLMFGCIGHPKNYSLDELLESGKVSHKVIDITIDKKTGEGIAEYEILDTPSGRILNTIMRSGSQMYVSTRAFGGFTSETKKKDGRDYKVLDAKNFELESIDFVIEPGFLQTNPKILESISEDLEMLFEDKAQIQCDEGICQLREDFIALNEDKTDKGESKMDPFENLMSLPKEDIISMLRNVVAENKMLSGKEVKEFQDTDDNADDDDVTKGSKGELTVDAKLLSNYISYVELLTKMVRYNVEYEKYYEDLISFLDKDDKLSTKDMASIDKIVGALIKEKDLEESLLKVCEKIQILAELLSDDAKDGKTDDEKKKEADESLVSFLAPFIGLVKESSGDKSDLVEKELEISVLKSQIERLREATIALSESTMTVEIREVPVEVIVEKIINKTPKEISDKLVESQDAIKLITEEKESLQEKLEAVVAESSETIKNLEVMIEEHKMFAREIKLEDNKVIKSLTEKLETTESTLAKRSALAEKLGKQLEKTKANEHKHEVSYLASLYKLEKSVVESIIEKSKDEDDKKSLLEKESKLSRRSTKIVEDVPDYNPNQRQKVRFSKLESLMG